MEGELTVTVRQIVEVLEEVLGRASRWNGRAFLARSLSFAGAAHYDGGISISELIYADTDLRWRTLVHEVLHTFSPFYSSFEYHSAPGWEEGVVEQMQRLMRPQVLAALNVAVQEKSCKKLKRGIPITSTSRLWKNFADASAMTRSASTKCSLCIL